MTPHVGHSPIVNEALRSIHSLQYDLGAIRLEVGQLSHITTR
jgi:hypothetical protein